MKKFENFQKTLDILKTFDFQRANNDVIYRSGGIWYFNATFERAIKVIREKMLQHGYSEYKLNSPKQILKAAYSAEMITDQEKWLTMLESRNDIVHSYNEEIAFKIIAAVKADYIALFDELKTEILENWV